MVNILYNTPPLASMSSLSIIHIILSLPKRNLGTLQNRARGWLVVELKKSQDA